MNCTRCQHELSQCLDGRLGSGRRAVVMRHVTRCPSCARFWSELQKAQELVLNLPAEPVSPGFRAQLWERIKSGEGTPEAVFREPVPIATKFRYVLTGAAAAAAVLVAVYTWVPAKEQPRSETEVVAGNGIDPGVPSNRPGRRDLGPRVDYQDMPFSLETGVRPVDPRPLTADLVATEAARNFQQYYTIADDHIRRLGSQNARQTNIAVRRICDSAAEMKILGCVLLDLNRSQRIVFPELVARDLATVVNSLDEKRLRKHDLDAVHNMVVPVFEQAYTLRELPTLMSVRPSFHRDEDREFLREFAEIIRHRPSLFNKLFVRFSAPEAEPMNLRAFGGNLFEIQDECGTYLVVPKSSMIRSSILIHTGHGRRMRVEIEAETTTTEHDFEPK